MRTWGLMLKFIPFGWNAVLTYQCLRAEQAILQLCA